MRFGHFCLPTYVPERDLPQEAYMHRLVDFFASSEELGFDALWASCFQNIPNMCSDHPLTAHARSS